MKKRNKNKSLQTFDVYPHLPEYQYTTGVPKARHAGEFYTYDDYLTHTLPIADVGDEKDPIEVKNMYNLNSKMPDALKEGYASYGVPKSMQGSNLAHLFNMGKTVSDFSKTAKTAKEKGSWNINPMTGKPYSKTDFQKATITNYSNQNVIIDEEGLANMFDEKGNLISDMNTADNLFMTQKEARAGYYNQLADYHASEFLDENEFLADGTTKNPNFGKPLLSKQQMNIDNSKYYAPINTGNKDETGSPDEFLVDGTTPNPDYNPNHGKPIMRNFESSDLTKGDIAQANLYNTNAQRFKTDNSGDVVSFNTGINEKGEVEDIIYDENEVYGNTKYRPGGSFPRNNLAAFINGGDLPKAQQFNSETGVCYNCGIPEGYPHNTRHSQMLISQDKYLKQNPYAGTVSTFMNDYYANIPESEVNTKSVQLSPDYWKTQQQSPAWLVDEDLRKELGITDEDVLNFEAKNWQYQPRKYGGTLPKAQLLNSETTDEYNTGIFNIDNLITNDIVHAAESTGIQPYVDKSIATPYKTSGREWSTPLDGVTNLYNDIKDIANLGVKKVGNKVIKPLVGSTLSSYLSSILGVTGSAYGLLDANLNLHNTISDANPDKNPNEIKSNVDMFYDGVYGSSHGPNPYWGAMRQTGGSLPKAQFLNSELTSTPLDKTNLNYKLSMNRPVIDSNGKCWANCGQRFFDPQFNMQTGISTEVNLTPAEELAAMQARVWAGLTYTADQSGRTQAGLKTYLGGNAGVEGVYSNLLNEYNVQPVANIVGNIGFEGDAEDMDNYKTYARMVKQDRRGDPHKYGYGVTAEYDLLNTPGEFDWKNFDWGAYLNFNKTGLTFNYNPATNMKTFGLQLGLPDKKEGGRVLPKAHDGTDMGAHHPHAPGTDPDDPNNTFIHSGITTDKTQKCDYDDGRGMIPCTEQEFNDLEAKMAADVVEAGKQNIFNTNVVVNPEDEPDFDVLQQKANVNLLEDPNDNNDWDNDGVPNFIDATPGDRPAADDSLFPVYGPANNPTPIEMSWGDTPFQEFENKVMSNIQTGPIGEAVVASSEIAGTAANLAGDTSAILESGITDANEMITRNEIGTAMTTQPIIEASRTDKGDFDLTSGVHRATTLGYGDGPWGQIAQTGQEMNGNTPPPNYAYLQEFLNNAIIGYNPEFLMMQANKGLETMVQRKNGGQVIDADINLIKQLMAAGADFEML